MDGQSEAFNSSENANIPNANNLIHNAPPSGPQQKPAMPKKGGGKQLYLAAGIVIVLILAAGLILMLSGNGGSGSGNLASNPIYLALTKKPLNITNIISAFSAAGNETQALKQFTINYTGSMGISINSTLLGNIQIPLPLKLQESKYGNDVRVDVNVSLSKLSATLAKPILINYVSIKNVSYICGLQSVIGMFLTSGTGNSSVTCTKMSSLTSNATTGMSATENLTKLSALSKMISFSDVNVTESSYNGQKCVQFVGDMSIKMNATANTPAESLSGPISVCFNENNGMLLKASFGLSTENYSVSLVLNEENVAYTASQSYVDTLPGPVVNYTSYYSNSGGSMLGNQCIATSGYLCDGFNATSSTSVGFVFGQATGTTFSSFSLACVEGFGIPPGSDFIQSAQLGAGGSMVSGATAHVVNLPCYNFTTGKKVTFESGKSFVGYLWVKYAEGLSNAGNSTTEFATMSLPDGYT